MHALHEYLCEQLGERLRKHRIVVFYDPREEFRPFFDQALPEIGRGHGELPRIQLGEEYVFLARFAGSFFGLRAAIEPIASLREPDPLIVYLAGVERDRQGSVLMEVEKGGTVYEPQLRQLARHAFRRRFTDGQIDEMLPPGRVDYVRLVSFLAQGDEPGSVLRTLFDGLQSEALIARWLGDES